MKGGIKIVGQSHTSQDRYQHSDLKIQVPNNDSDIEIQLPNGRSMTLQWRIESECVDVCLDEHRLVHNWSDDMKSAEPQSRHPSRSHIRKAIQLVIDFGGSLRKTKKPKPERHLTALASELAYFDQVTAKHPALQAKKRKVKR